MADDKKPTRVDDQFLAAMGLPGLKGKRKQAALGNALNVININVGKRVADSLNEEQVKQFEEITSKEELNEDELASWIKQNVPDYEKILEEETQKLHDETKTMVDDVMKMGHHGAEPTY